MPHSYSLQFVHCVFSTKNRENLISELWQPRLYAYIYGIAKNLNLKILACGGTENHIHLLVALPATVTLAEVVQKLKANSSRWMRERLATFEWQKGYGAFSVSPSLLSVVEAYIRNQRRHHARRNFDDEFVALLKKSGIAYDPMRLFAA